MQRISRQTCAIALSIVGIIVTSCGQPSAITSSAATLSPNRSLTIAVVPKQLTNAYWAIVEKGVKCAASHMQNVTIQWNGMGAATDVTGQIALLQHYVEQRTDGIIYSATDAQALSKVSLQATAAQIPVINFDSGTTPQPNNIPLFATDNTAASEKAADIMAQLLHGHGKIAILPFQPGVQNSDQRENGFKQELMKYPGIQIVAEQSSNSDVTIAENLTNAILALHPDITGIYTANQSTTIGVARAISGAGLAGKVQIIGWDTAPEEISALQNGTISELVVQNPFKMGFDSVQAMVNLLRHQHVAVNEDTGVTFITHENLMDVDVQSLLNPKAC